MGVNVLQFDLHYSFRILPLLLFLMLLLDLLRSQDSVRVCIRVTHRMSKNADLCLSQKARA